MSISVIIILLFMLIPLIIGFIAATKSQNTSDDYFIQGRGMGSVAAFFTVSATWWSAFAFLGSNASFYTQGPVYLTAFAWNILFGFLYFIVGKRVWFLGKKFNYVTPSDLLGDFYQSEKMRFWVTTILIISTVPYLQIQLTGGGYLIEVASGGTIPFWLAGLMFYAVIIIYVWVGGIRAVAWTDIIYGALVFFGLLFVGFYISNVVGGPISLFEQMRAENIEHLTLPGAQGDSGYLSWISLCFITAIGAIMGPQLWLRMYAVKNGNLFNLMPFLISLVAVTYFGSLLVSWTGVLTINEIDNPDQLLPVVLYEYAPIVIATLVLAGGASAAMSTANSQIHAVSTLVTKDFYQRYKNPNASNNQLLRIGRFSILIFSLVAYLLTLFVPGFLVTIGLIGFGGSAQLIVPTLGALFWKRSNSPGALSGLISGFVTLLLFTFIPGWQNPLGLSAGMWGLMVNVIAFVTVTLLTPPRKQNTFERFNNAMEEFESNY